MVQVIESYKSMVRMFLRNSMKNKTLPQLQEPFALNEEQKELVARIEKELTHRVKTKVTITAYVENHLITGIDPLINYVHFEFQIGHWKRHGVISQAELSLGRFEVLYYSLRRLADETLNDLIIRGANSTSVY